MKNTATPTDINPAQKCLCGASTVGSWTGQGTHHQAHRCARVVTVPLRVLYARAR